MKRIHKTINDKVFTFKILGARDGFNMGIQISKLILPAIGASVDGIKSQSKAVDIVAESQDENKVLDVLTKSNNTFADAAMKLVDQMDNVDVLAIVDKMFKDMLVDDKEENWDEYFAGNYGEMLEVLTWLLKENFASFFSQSGILQKAQTWFNNLD